MCAFSPGTQGHVNQTLVIIGKALNVYTLALKHPFYALCNFVVLDVVFDVSI